MCAGLLLLLIVTPAHATPTTMFAANTNAQSGAANPIAITAQYPRLSWINTAGAVVDRQRVQLLSTPLTGVEALWHFDNVLTDSSGNGHTLDALPALPNDPLLTSAGGVPGFAQAIEFDGDDFVNAPADAGLNAATLTIEAWVRIDANNAGTYNYFIAKGNGAAATTHFRFGYATASGRIRLDVGNGAALTSFNGTAAGDIRGGGWHHVAAVINGTARTVSIFVDGVARTPAGNTFPNAVNNGVATLRFGGDSTPVYFQGALDDVRLSTVARTAAEDLGYTLTAQPHDKVLWDSDVSDSGIAIADCANAARCADISSGYAGVIADARYYVRAKYREKIATTWTSWSTYDWFEMSPSYIPPVTVSGFALRDEVGTAWAGCDGITANIGISYDGGAKSLIPCSGLTGAFTTQMSIIAGKTLVVFLDPAAATSSGATYISTSTVNITNIQLVQDRVWLRSDDGSVFDNGRLDDFDQSLPGGANIPVDAQGWGFMVIDTDTELHVQNGASYLDSFYVSAGSIHVAGGGALNFGYNAANVTRPGVLGCSFGAGLSRPLCLEPGATFSANNLHFNFNDGIAERAVIEAIDYGGGVTFDSDDGDVFEMGTGPGQQFAADEWNLRGYDGEVDAERWAPNVLLRKFGAFDAKFQFHSHKPFNFRVNGSLYGAATINAPQANLTIAPTESVAVFGPNYSYNQTPTGDWTFGSATFTNNYVRTPWGTGGTGVTTYTSAIGANADTAAFSYISNTERVVVGGRQPTNGGDWALTRYDSTGVLDTGYGPFGTGTQTWDSGGGNDFLRGALADGYFIGKSESFWAYGSQGKNNGDWAVRKYWSDGTLATGSFGGADTLEWNSGGAGADIVNSVANMGSGLYVAGVAGTGGGDWAIRRLDFGTGLWDPAFNSGAGVFTADSGGMDEINSIEIGNEHAAFVGSYGGNVTYRSYNQVTEAWETPFITVPLAGTQTVAATCGSPNYSKMYVAGTTSSNGGDIFVMRLDDGVLDPSFGTGGIFTWNSGASNVDAARSMLCTHDALWVTGAGNDDAVLLRLDNDGRLDPTVGTGGVVTYDSGGVDAGMSIDQAYASGDLYVAVTAATAVSDMQLRHYDQQGNIANVTGPAPARILAELGNAPIHFDGAVTVGPAAAASATILDAQNVTLPLDFNSSLTVASKGILRAPYDEAMTLAGNLTVNGTFHNDGGTLTLDDTSKTSQMSWSAPQTFAGLKSVLPNKRVVLPINAGAQTNVTGALELRGNCTSPLQLTSATAGTQAWLNATGSTLIDGATIQDSRAVTALTATAATSVSGNTGWTIGGGCATAPLPPSALFVHDSDASAGAVHAGPITNETPHFSWVNTAAQSVDAQQAEVRAWPIDERDRGLWHLEDGSNSVAGGQNLALPGGTANPTFIASKIGFGNGANFDGVNDYMSFVSDSTYESKHFTAAAWFKTPLAASGWDTLLSRTSGPAFSYDLSVEPSGVLRATVSICSDWNYNYRSSSTSVRDNLWHHAAIEWDGFKAVFYLDGKYQGTITSCGDPYDTAPGATVYVGGVPGGNFFQGMIDDVRISDAPRSTAEITGYVATGKPNDSLIWSSDVGTGKPLGGTCTTITRCLDIVYDGAGGSFIKDGARYYARGRYKTTAAATPPSTFTAWSDFDWFETGATLSIGVSAGATPTFNVSTAAVDGTATSTIQVATTSSSGYSLVATSPADAWGMTTGVTTIPRYTANPALPTVWAGGAQLGMGVTVVSATGGKDAARWGTGVTESDFINNRYVGLKRTTPSVIHQRSNYAAGTDSVVVGYRVNAPIATQPGLYRTVITYTAIPNA